MGAERDPAGSQGPGMSGTGFGANRDPSGSQMGGSPSLGDRPGSAEVHTGLHSGRSGEQYSGLGFAQASDTDQGLRNRAADAVQQAAGAVRDTAGTLGNRAGDVASQARDRAGELASNARDRVSGLMDRAHGVLEDRGMLTRVRENPLPALGIAFAVGFLLAGSSDQPQARQGQGQARGLTGSGGGTTQRARGELRTALLAGLSAGVAQGARQFLNQAGREGGFLNSVLQNMAGPSQGGAYGGQTRGGGGQGQTRTPQGQQQGAYTGGTGTTSHREPSHREFR